MRKRLYVLLISCATLLSAHAQLSDKGYYRIQNVNTKDGCHSLTIQVGGLTMFL